MPKIMNLFIRVVDNLGDIGFAADVIRSFEEHYPGHYLFDIWTNDEKKVKSFFDKNPQLEGNYSIRGIEEIGDKRSSLSLLLFHHPIPKNYPFAESELFLRIDYLSFEKNWVKHHGKEHLDSREGCRVIEIIPSPLPESGGLIVPTKHFLTKQKLAEKFGLDSQKKWITLFVYPDTFKDRCVLDGSSDLEIIVLGKSPEHDLKNPKYHQLPFISLQEFSSIIRESEWAIIRGEVSFISTLQLSTPFFWDMYKEIGGFHTEQAEQFLDWFVADEAYKNIFYRLNGQINQGVHLSEINNYFRDHPERSLKESKNLVEELQNYIDKYHFSL